MKKKIDSTITEIDSVVVGIEYFCGSDTCRGAVADTNCGLVVRLPDGVDLKKMRMNGPIFIRAKKK